MFQSADERKQSYEKWHSDKLYGVFLNAARYGEMPSNEELVEILRLAAAMRYFMAIGSETEFLESPVLIKDAGE